MPTVDERFPATDRKVLRRLDEGAIRQVMLGILATLASFVAIAWLSDLWQTRPRLTVVFGVLLAVVGLLQSLLIIGFESIYPRGPQRWRRRLVVTLLLQAAAWSAFIVVLMRLEGSGHLFFLAMFLPLILGAALAATWLADIWTVRIYLAISLLPPTLALMLDRELHSALVAVFLLVYLYALIRVSDHHFRLFWRVLGRREQGPVGVVPPGNTAARLLVRTADEFRQPVANVADVLSLVADNRDDPALMASARRSAQQLVDRLEVLSDAASLLRGERVVQLTAGSLRRRCEEVADDIGVVAADGGVLCTTLYAEDLPARIRTDFGLLFRALRCVGVWVLEQMPANSEMLLHFQVVRGLHEDRLRCAVDIRGIYLSASLRSALDRTTQGSGLLESGIPLPLAVAGELARLLGGKLSLAEAEGTERLALDVRLEIADHTEESIGELRDALAGQRVLLAGLTPALAGALTVECDRLGIQVAYAEHLDELAAAVATHTPRTVLCDGRDIARAAQVLRGLRGAGLVASTRVVLLSPHAEAPALPEDLQKLAADWLRLPLGRRRLLQFFQRLAGVAEVPAGKQAPVQGALRVLIVEDNPVNQQVARGMLEKLGCEVEVLEDGALAVERVARGGLDLVLMDGEMPGMDGAEATRRIRAREVEKNLPRLPIVAMTAHNGEAEVAGFLAAGMDDCLAKPVSLASMAARIERYRQRR